MSNQSFLEERASDTFDEHFLLIPKMLIKPNIKHAQ